MRRAVRTAILFAIGAVLGEAERKGRPGHCICHWGTNPACPRHGLGSRL